MSASIFCGYDDDEVALGGVRRGRGLGLDRDLFGVVQVLLRHAADRGGHRRREQRDLLGVGGVGEDRLDVLGEAHLQHLVGLVEHEVLELGQVEGALVEVVHDAAGRADDDVHAAAQRRQLHAVALSAVDRQHVHAAQVRGVLLERLADLQGELARGREHERLRRLLRHVEARRGSAARTRRSCRCRSGRGRRRRGPRAAVGMVAAWIADGVSYPTSRSALSTASPSPRSENVIGAGSAGASSSTETSPVDTLQGSPSGWESSRRRVAGADAPRGPALAGPALPGLSFEPAADAAAGSPA